MQKRYLLVMVVVLILGIAAVFHYGDSPSPTVFFEAAENANLEEVGTKIFDSLAGELASESLIVFGISATDLDQKAIVEQFLASTNSKTPKIDFIFQEEGLPAIKVPEGTEVLVGEFNSDPMMLIPKLKERLDQGKRGLIFTVNLYSSHLLTQNPISRFEQSWGKRVPSITTISIGIVREQEFRVDPPCLGSERDGQGTSALGCAALHKQRSLYRKELDTSKIVSMMDKQSEKDFLAFVYLPVKK